MYSAVLHCPVNAVLLLLQIGMFQKRLLDAFHPDALYLLQSTLNQHCLSNHLPPPPPPPLTTPTPVTCSSCLGLCFITHAPCLTPLCPVTLMLIAVLLQIGLSQKRLLDAFHPDALYLFQMTTDLQYVCTKLADPNVREPRMVRHKAGCFGCVCVGGGGSTCNAVVREGGEVGAT